ncbi:hypothetical protein [Streptomyces niveus]|uniref:hypothetical protein n=1 Tax=Streptomyces niveus TaxID=193462 RepID=UPI00342DD41D
MGKKKAKKPKGWWVAERAAKAKEAKRKTAARERYVRVYGRASEVPPDAPSVSVRAFPSGAHM